MLRVCHLVISLAPGGLERLVVDWTNARNERQPASTQIVCLDAEGELAEEVDRRADAIVTCLQARRRLFPWDVAAVSRLRRLLQARCQVVHSHNLAAHQYAVLATRGTAVPLVHTEHGSNVHTAGWLNRLRLRGLAHRTAALVAVSGDTARRMAPAWNVAPAHIAVIPNGVAMPAPQALESRQEWRERLVLPADAFVLGSVGRLAPVKGFDRLLEVLPEVLRRCPDVHWVLIGEGPQRELLERRAWELGVQTRVHLAGFRRDARRCYPAFDLLVAPSRSEGLPVALLEAMAAGCPVAVTDAGAQRAVVDDGQAGLLLPDDEPSWPALIAAARGGGLQTRAEAARRRVAGHYSLANTVDAYERIYERVAAVPRSVPGERP